MQCRVAFEWFSECVFVQHKREVGKLVVWHSRCHFSTYYSHKSWIYEKLFAPPPIVLTLTSSGLNDQYNPYKKNPNLLVEIGKQYELNAWQTICLTVQAYMWVHMYICLTFRVCSSVSANKRFFTTISCSVNLRHC